MPIVKRHDPFKIAIQGASIAAKHEALWVPCCVKAIRLIDAGWIGNGEAIRFKLTKAGFPEPPHHNKWGNAINLAKKWKIIMPTGETDHMKDPRSHGRKTDIYIRTYNRYGF